MDCLDPVLEEMPEDDWYCKQCSLRQENSNKKLSVRGQSINIPAVPVQAKVCSACAFGICID